MDPILLDKSREKQMLANKEHAEDSLNKSSSLMNNNILQDSRKDTLIKGEIEEVVPLKKIKKKALTTKQRMIKNEKRSGDYSRLGIAFDLTGVDINEADSPKMVNLKKALKNYLLVREEVMKAEDRIAKEKQEALEQKGMNLIHTGKNKTASGLTEINLDALSEAYTNAYRALQDYTAFKCIWFKWGRGRARLKQVKAIADMLQKDNREFGLNELRRDLNESIDRIEHEGTKGCFPSFYGVVRNKDYIDKRHAKLRKEGRNNSLHIGWYGALLKDLGNCALGLWHLAGGTATRTLAVPTFIAANALEFTGKVGKLALKGLSEVVNLGLKLFRQKKRWHVRFDRHTLTHGWTSFNDARITNYNFLKHTLGLPLSALVIAPIHFVCRGLKNLGRDRFERKALGDVWGEHLGIFGREYKKMFKDKKDLLKKIIGTTKDLYALEAAEMQDISSHVYDEEANKNDDDDDNDNDNEE